MFIVTKWSTGVGRVLSSALPLCVLFLFSFTFVSDYQPFVHPGKQVKVQGYKKEHWSRAHAVMGLLCTFNQGAAWRLNANDGERNFCIPVHA